MVEWNKRSWGSDIVRDHQFCHREPRFTANGSSIEHAKIKLEGVSALKDQSAFKKSHKFVVMGALARNWTWLPCYIIIDCECKVWRGVVLGWEGQEKISWIVSLLVPVESLSIVFRKLWLFDRQIDGAWFWTVRILRQCCYLYRLSVDRCD